MNKKEYLLVCLAEEGAEIAQAATKCLRFTTENQYPGYTRTNLERLDIEITDLLTILYLLEAELHFEFNKLPSITKMKATEEYMQIATKLGTLQ